MTSLTAADLIPYAEYERVRQAFRQQVIALKQRRRLSVGPRITLLFENRRTLQFQIQEMIRAERIVDPVKVQDELDVYNHLLPAPGELSATLFIEITDEADIKAELDAFQGIDRGETVAIQVGSERTFGLFEGGHSKEDKISAVHFVRFRIPRVWASLLASDSEPVSLVVQHGVYRAAVAVPPAMRAEWLADLSDQGPLDSRPLDSRP